MVPAVVRYRPELITVKPKRVIPIQKDEERHVSKLQIGTTPHPIKGLKTITNEHHIVLNTLYQNWFYDHTGARRQVEVTFRNQLSTITLGWHVLYSNRPVI